MIGSESQFDVAPFLYTEANLSSKKGMIIH